MNYVNIDNIDPDTKEAYLRLDHEILDRAEGRSDYREKWRTMGMNGPGIVQDDKYDGKIFFNMN